MEIPPTPPTRSTSPPTDGLKHLLKVTAGFLITSIWLATSAISQAQAVWQSQSSAGGGGTAATSPSVPKPAGLAAGDLMVMSVGVESGSSTTITATGWTPINRQDQSSNVGLATFWKIATSTDVAATSFSVTFNSSKKWSMGISRITGHNPVAPIAASAGTQSASSATAIVAPSVTTTAANQLVLGFYAVKKSATFSNPTPFNATTDPGTERYDVAADPPSHAAYTYVRATQGATGTRTATSSQPETWAAIQVAVATQPVISASGTPAAVNTTYGTASPTPTSFTLSGSNLTAGVTVTAPTGYQVSTSSGSGYATSVVVGAAGTIPSTTVYLRLAATTTVGTYSGNVTLSSSGATNVTLATTASTVAKATPTINTPPTASSITFGQTLANSSLTSGSASVAGTFAFTTPSTAPAAGTSTHGVTFTPNDSLNYNSATTTVSVTVNKAAASVSLNAADLTRTYDGSPKPVTVTTVPAGLAVSLTYNGSTSAPSAAGTYPVVATVTDSNYSGSASNTLVISKRALAITAANLSKTVGSSDPTLTYQAVGLVTGDSILGSLTRAAGETPGIYSITLGSLFAGDNYSVSFTGANFVITGLKAIDDVITKPADNSPMKIPVADLLFNDGILGPNGAVTAASGLAIAAVQPGNGSTATLSGRFILFSPSSAPTDTITYTLSNGSETSTATVAVTQEAGGPTPFALQITERGVAEFNGSHTVVSHDFIGEPNQTYHIEYTSNLQQWISTGNHPTGVTGSFFATFTQAGNHVSDWNGQMFFRATKQ
jgi:hypothetical protein